MEGDEEEEGGFIIRQIKRQLTKPGICELLMMNMNATVV